MPAFLLFSATKRCPRVTSLTGLLTPNRDTAARSFSWWWGQVHGVSVGSWHVLWRLAAAMGRKGQPVFRLCRDRRRSDCHLCRRGPCAAPPRLGDGRPVRPEHSPPCRQPTIVHSGREPCGPGDGGARRAKRGWAERTHQEDEGDPGGHPGEAWRDHRTRRGQAGHLRAQRNHQEHPGSGAEPDFGRSRTSDARRPARQAI